MSNTKNVGQVSGLYIGTSAPNNTDIIWYDSSSGQRCHKVYDFSTNSWKALNPEILSNITYYELTQAARNNGLSVGKHYCVRDLSNTLAVAVTSTKVQYIDSLGNIIIDDLGTNKQYHVSQGNLLIDDVSGVFDTKTNKLVFSFDELDIKTATPTSVYLLAKRAVGLTSRFVKFKINSIVSTLSSNSLSWKSGGVYFSFSSAIKNILNKAGGIVGYDEYEKRLTEIGNNITTVSDHLDTYSKDLDNKMSEYVSETNIYSKQIYEDVVDDVAPSDVKKNDTLLTIIKKFQRWVSTLKYATGVKLSENYADAKTSEWVNNNDSVQTALGKLQYRLKHTGNSVVLSSDWEESDPEEDGEMPEAGDGFDSVIKKIVSYIKKIKLSYDKISSYNKVVGEDRAVMVIDLHNGTITINSNNNVASEFTRNGVVLRGSNSSNTAVLPGAIQMFGADGASGLFSTTSMEVSKGNKEAVLDVDEGLKIKDGSNQEVNLGISGLSISSSGNSVYLNTEFGLQISISNNILQLNPNVISLSSGGRLAKMSPYNGIELSSEDGMVNLNQSELQMRDGDGDVTINSNQLRLSRNNSLVFKSDNLYAKPDEYEHLSGFDVRRGQLLTNDSIASTENIRSCSKIDAQPSVGKEYSAAFTAVNPFDGDWNIAFDAVFNRLNVGILTRNALDLKDADYFSVVNNKCGFIINSSSDEKIFMLPVNVAVGASIIVNKTFGNIKVLSRSNKDGTMNAIVSGSDEDLMNSYLCDSEGKMYVFTFVGWFTKVYQDVQYRGYWNVSTLN